MGGKALKKVNVIRLEKSEYDKLKNKIYNILLPYLKISFLYEVPDKMDFGDLDILYDVNSLECNLQDLIVKIFNPKEIVKNGSVLSFSYLIDEKKNIYFQIDLIQSNNIEMDLFYFSYGDFGAILGKITKYYGLTFGNTGLWINLYKDTIIKYTNDINKISMLKRIDLTDNPEQICKYLCLDYKKWEKGFRNNNELYEYIKKCKYFNSHLFDCNISNHEYMRRYNERKIYREFVEYIKDDKEEIPNSINNQYEAIKYFHKINDLEKLIEKNILQNERKEKFNGHIIQEYIKSSNFQKNTNKIGENKELGIFMMNFKNDILKNGNLYNTFDDYIDKNEKEIIKKDIIDFYKFNKAFD